MELSVVIPVLNEEKNIQPLADEIQLALGGKIAFEIIFVDDGSTDNTSQSVRLAAKNTSASIRLLHHPYTAGQSTAVYSGVLAARGELIATLDGDGQNDPADILRMLECMRANGNGDPIELVIGYRKKRSDSFVRIVSSRIANGVRGRFLHDDTPDTGCGLKVFRRQTFLELPYFDHMHRFMPALVQRGGGRVVSLSVRHRPRMHGHSKYGINDRLWAGIIDLAGVAWLQHHDRRPRNAIEENFHKENFHKENFHKENFHKENFHKENIHNESVHKENIHKH